MMDQSHGGKDGRIPPVQQAATRRGRARFSPPPTPGLCPSPERVTSEPNRGGKSTGKEGQVGDATLS